MKVTYFKEQRIEFVESIDLNAGYKVFKKHKSAKQIIKHVCSIYFNGYIYQEIS